MGKIQKVGVPEYQNSLTPTILQIKPDSKLLA
jgi:hypothetical protein